MAKTLRKSRHRGKRHQSQKARQDRRSTGVTPAENTEQELALVGRHPRDADRNARGQFTSGNDGHLQSGVHSLKRWAELAPLLQEQRAAILQAKGHDENDVDPVYGRIVDAFVQSVTMMDS